MLHSLAFGTLRPYLALDPAQAIGRKNMEMTLDVMAHSLVYWAQDVWRAGMFSDGSKIYAMTSEGSTRVIDNYGAVSAAKSALESHCRQLALEFAKLGSGVTVNAIRAGVTMTPALMQIPERDAAHRARQGQPDGPHDHRGRRRPGHRDALGQWHPLDHRQRPGRRRRRADRRLRSQPERQISRYLLAAVGVKRRGGLERRAGCRGR